MAASWKITLPSGTTHNMATVSAGVYNTVAELLDNADWKNIEPTAGPRQLVAWVAILMALESEDKDIMVHLTEVMTMPMVDVLKMLQVSTDKE